MRILLPPLRDVRFVPLVAPHEVVLAEVRQDVRALLGNEHTRIFRIGEVDLGNLLGVVPAVRVQLRHEAQVNCHARLARLRGVAGIDACDHGERVVPLGHGLRRHAEQHSVRVNQSNLLAVPGKRHRLPLHNRQANLVGQHAHYSRVLDPGNTLKCPASLIQRHKKNVAADVFAKDGQQVGAAHLGEARSVNVAGTGDAETRIAFEKMRQHKAGRGEAAQHQERGKREKHAACFAGRTRPMRSRRCLGRAKPLRGRVQHSVAFRVVELEGHARRVAPARCGGAHSSVNFARAPGAQLRGGIVVPQQGPVCRIALIGHA